MMLPSVSASLRQSPFFVHAACLKWRPGERRHGPCYHADLWRSVKQRAGS